MIYYFQYKAPKRVTGAHLFYKRVSELLSQLPNSRPIPDFWQFAGSGIKALGPRDVLVTNNGPYAFILHYLRQLYNLQFRIVRDVQASLHVSYLFQELACTNFLRPRDAILFPSHYTLTLYTRLFPHIRNAYVCYPCIEAYPRMIHKPPKEFTLGYLGRASIAKNFHQVIEMAPRLKHRILVAGSVDFPRLPKNIIPLGELPPNKVWDFLSQISVLLFPSTANIESLGRVLLEANHVGLPTVTANFGASPELSPNNALVHLSKEPVDLQHNNPLGRVDEKEFISLIKNPALGSNAHYKAHDLLLYSIVRDKAEPTQLRQITPDVQKFIDHTKIYINWDYNKVGIGAIKEFMALLKKEELSEIGPTSHSIAEQMNFNPRWNPY